MSFKPPPSKLELIKLRRQLKLFQRIRKTLEDARNSTIQRIRALISELERERREVADIFWQISQYFKMAVAKEGIDKIEAIAALTPKTARVELVNKGAYIGLKISGFTSYPSYSLTTEAAELDMALIKARDAMSKLISFAEKETLFYTLLNKVREYQRMINALDYVIMPKIEESIQSIRLALEEAEREEFIRRKIITSTI